jgi:hypothetical protein
VVTGLASLCIPVAALSAEPSKYGKVRLGPVYLTPRLSINAGVDDNVYNAEQAQIADEAVVVTPSLEVVVPVGRRFRVRSLGSVMPHYFVSEKSQRHTDRYGRVGVEGELSRFGAFAWRGAGRYRQRFSLELDERIAREESSWGFGGNLRVGTMTARVSQRQMTSLYAQGAQVQDFAVNSALDRETLTRTAEVNVPLTRRTTFVPWVDFVQDRFLSGAPTTDSRVDSQRFAAALEFTEKAFVAGRVALGVRRFGPREGVAPYQGLYAAVDVGIPLPLANLLQLGATRDVAFTVTPAAAEGIQRNTAIESTYRADLRFPLPAAFFGRASAAYSTFDYLLPTLQDGVAIDRKDEGWGVGGALLRRFGSHVSVGGMVQRSNRHSTLPGHSYRGMIYGATGEIRF